MGDEMTDFAMVPATVRLQDIPALLKRMKARLDEAETSAKVLEVRAEAKSVLHLSKLMKATDETKADCLRIVMFAEVRIADEIDAGQERGDVAKPNQPVSQYVQTADIPATYDDIGVSRQRVAEWRKLRDCGGEDAIDAAINDLLAKGREPTHSNVERAVKGQYFSTKYSGDYEWYTPEEYVEAARECMGEIDLDPASSDAAQEKVQATEYFTVDDDGLVREWNGRVWLNPPYSQPEITNFIEKLVAEVEAGRTTEAVLLTHNHTDTGWAHLAFRAASAICFTRGRIRFVNANGDTGVPTQGQAFFYFGGNVGRFAETVGQFGHVVVSYV